MSKVVVFNGPPGSGKDTAAHAANRIASVLQNSSEVKQFKDKLFTLTAEMYSVPRDLFTGEMYTRENKERPYITLGGLSPRQALIRVSEDIMKPAFGKDYFGKALAAEIYKEYTFVSDSGFMDELVPVINRVGPENVLVVQITREGCSFDNDSRDYLDPDELFYRNVSVVSIDNPEGQEEEFVELVLDVIGEWDSQ